MPRFYLHLQNGVGKVTDEDGIEMASAAAARTLAIDNIRSIAAEEIRRGMLDLTGHIDVMTEAGEVLQHITFLEAFQISPEDLFARQRASEE